MADVVHRAGLKHEAPDGVAVLGQPARQDLDRYFLADEGMERAVHRTHSALGDTIHDLVLAHQGAGLQPRDGGRLCRGKGS